MQFHALERTAIERELEKRFEKMCEKNGWIASANFLYGTQTASLVLEKFSKEPISPDDAQAAHMMINDFIIADPDLPYIADDKLNKERWEEEEAAGLHKKGKKK